MSSQMPELGSKISLISKADIRYEGRLFQVDPTECTIALANVRSFGTEDRETSFPVPAQSQIYEYILFRGSDIKDIRVLNNSPLHQDPAIVQLVPPVMNQQQSFQNPAINHAVLGQTNSGLGPFPAYSGGVNLGLQRSPGQLLMQPSELGPISQPNVPISGPSTLEKDQDMIGGVSRSATPSRKSPTIDQGTQVTSSPPRDDNKRHPRPIQPPHRENREYRERDGGGRREQGGYYQRDEGGYRRPEGDYRRPEGDYRRPPEGEYRRPYHDNNRNDFYNRRPNMRRDDQMDNRNNQYQNRNQNRLPGEGGWVQRNPNMQNNQLQQRQPPRGGMRRGMPRQLNNRTGAPQANKKNTLKFEGDYDFDKANTEFEELRSQLTKLKVGEDDAVVGEGKEQEKKEDSGNETGTGEPEQEEDAVFYDKKKSFFDAISCEAVERSKGRSQRTDWRTERKLNSETFGVSSARRGMYRGRGYYGGGRGYGYNPRSRPPPRENNAAPAPPSAAGASAEAPLPQKMAPVEEKPVNEPLAAVAVST